MHNIKILLFCWKLPSIPSPPGADHVTPCGSGSLFDCHGIKQHWCAPDHLRRDRHPWLLKAKYHTKVGP